MTDSITVRTVLTADRVEWHAEQCAHRIPRGAEVIVSQRTSADVAEVHAEAIDLADGPSPVKPCLRSAAGLR